MGQIFVALDLGPIYIHVYRIKSKKCQSYFELFEQPKSTGLEQFLTYFDGLVCLLHVFSEFWSKIQNLIEPNASKLLVPGS